MAPPSAIFGISLSVRRFNPRIFTRMTVSAGMVAATPALLNSTSTLGLPSAVICSIALSIEIGLLISVSINSATSKSGFLISKTMMWSAPAIFSRSTKEAPIPEYAPVTTTLFPAKLINESILVSSSNLNSANKYRVDLASDQPCPTHNLKRFRAITSNGRPSLRHPKTQLTLTYLTYPSHDRFLR